MWCPDHLRRACWAGANPGASHVAVGTLTDNAGHVLMPGLLWGLSKANVSWHKTCNSVHVQHAASTWQAM